MIRFKAKKKIGMSPGTLVYVGDRTDEPVILEKNAPVLADESEKADG